MIVAYSISGSNNGAHYFEEAPESFFCSSCGCVIDQGYIPKRLLHLKKKINDFTYTYDGRPIVKKQFREFCEHIYPSDIQFTEVNEYPSLFMIHIMNKLVFDSKRRKTLFEDYCNTCMQYVQVAGATPGFLRNTENPIQRGFFHTDVEFGSYKEKNTMIIVGIETKTELIKRNFTGLEFRPIYGLGEKVIINGVTL